MRMYFAGEWQDRGERIDVTNPFNGEIIDNVPRGSAADVEVDAGNLHINWGTQWRADFMPYGGLKDSGLGKEGPRYAIREMTEEKMVVIH